MASLICIKMVCGTFCQLFNIANRFLWYFSNLETSIRNWFPGGARYPLLPAQLIGRGLFQIQVVQSRRNNSFIVVFTLHSSKFLNVIHKNCKYMHVDKDIHRNSYTSLCIRSLFEFITSDNVQYLSFSMFCPQTTNSLTRYYLQFMCGSYQHLILSSIYARDVKHDSRASA